MAEKSKILVIGATGYLGKYILEASANMGHPSFALVRESTVANPEKSALIESFKIFGVTLLYGDINDHESLVKALKQVDVVISTVGSAQVADQVKIIEAIKEAGNIKRFLPSEFTMDVDRLHAVEPAKSSLKLKAMIRRTVESEGIPYTFVSSNAFANHFLPGLGQAGATVPPRDEVVIFGDGNVKLSLSTEEDIGTYTIKAVDDPRTLNKILYLRLPANVLTINEIVALWEKKIGKTLKKIYISEDQLLKNLQESSLPSNMILSISYSAMIKGDTTNFAIEASFGVEASELYPDVKYTTIDEYLDQFV